MAASSGYFSGLQVFFVRPPSTENSRDFRAQFSKFEKKLHLKGNTKLCNAAFKTSKLVKFSLLNSIVTDTMFLLASFSTTCVLLSKSPFPPGDSANIALPWFHVAAKKKIATLSQIIQPFFFLITVACAFDEVASFPVFPDADTSDQWHAPHKPRPARRNISKGNFDQSRVTQCKKSLHLCEEKKNSGMI